MNHYCLSRLFKVFDEVWGEKGMVVIYFTLGVYLGMPEGEEVASGMEAVWLTAFRSPMGM